MLATYLFPLYAPTREHILERLISVGQVCLLWTRNTVRVTPAQPNGY